MDRQRLEALMESHKLDAVVAMSPENVYYLSKTFIYTQRSIRDRLAMVLWPLGQAPSFVVCVLEEAQAKQDSWIEDVRSYFEFESLPVELLAEVLAERGLTRSRIGVEMKYLSARDFLRLQTLVPGLDMVDCSDLLEEVRMIKTPEEVEILRRAAHSTDQVIRSTFNGIHAGKTEQEIYTELQVGLLNCGAAPGFNTVAAGKNSCITHPQPSSYAVQPGDIVRTDFGGCFHQYLSDIARTCVVSESTSRQQDIYKWLWDVHNRLIDAMTVGRRVSDIYELCRQLYEGAGMPFDRPHIGHGIGLIVHETPIINPYTDMELAPNMVLCIEPSHLEPGVGRYHVEDMVLITARGPEILSRSADWSTLLVVG